MSKKYLFGFLLTALCLLSGCGKDDDATNLDDSGANNDSVNNVDDKKDVGNNIPITNPNSNSRVYAVMINNYPAAVKVQTGLADAFLVYELPVEGGMSRSMALYKDKTTAKIGTVRSSRHDFLDYVLENDAIYVHWGYSHYAQEDIPKLGINNVNGLSDSPFWRENPEKLATEHTGYTGLDKVIAFAKKNGYRQTSTVSPVLNYKSSVVDLSDKEGSQVASSVELVYSNIYKVKFVYNKDENRYYRYVNGVKHTDYFTKEHYSTKNIIVVKLDCPYADDGYYLNLKNIGTGKGYYITNGKAVEITWEKKDRKSQTIYKYLDGKEIEVNDGNTYIMLHPNGKSVSISK